MNNYPDRSFDPDKNTGKVELLNGLYEAMILVGQEHRQSVLRIGFGVVTLLLVATGFAMNRPDGLSIEEEIFWSVGMMLVVILAQVALREMWKRYRGVYFCIGRINQVQRGHIKGEYLDGEQLFPESFKAFLPDSDGRVSEFEPIFRITRWMIIFTMLICLAAVILAINTSSASQNAAFVTPSSSTASPTHHDEWQSVRCLPPVDSEPHGVD